jgi:two-component system chemotaxis response regulator CheY
MAEFDFSSCNITVIDDEAFVRQLLVKVLTDIGVQCVYEAENGRDALAVLSGLGAATNLIICDLEMPEMDGFEFVSTLRADDDPDLSSLPVLILTGHIEQEYVEKAVVLGIHGYLKKPINKTSLEQRMVRALTAAPIDARRLKR